MHKGESLSAKPLGESLLFKMTDLAMVRPASSDLWKADPVSSNGNTCSIWQSLSSFKIIYSSHYQLNCFRSYYSVVVGWCFYYLFRSIFYHLPNSIQESSGIWKDLQVTSENNFGFGYSMLVFKAGADQLDDYNNIIVWKVWTQESFQK